MATVKQCDICKRTTDEMKGEPIFTFTENHTFMSMHKTSQFDICANCLTFIRDQMRKKDEVEQ